MVELRPAKRRELDRFARMERLPDTGEYILPWSHQRHLSEFDRGDVLYLAIIADDALAGFCMLAVDGDGESVELRRIVVETRGAGIGQQSIKQMESYCREQLGRKRIWLDVFDDNHRGRHIYARLGYVQFDQRPHADRQLLLLHKSIA